MDILLIRHGESEANRKKVLISDRHDPLSESGIKQSKLLRAKIEELRLEPTHLYASPWNRAASTLRIIYPNLAEDANYDERLAETNPGIYSTWLEADFLDKFPCFSKDIKNKYEGGESHKEMANRVQDWVMEVIDSGKKAPGLVVVVAHGGPLSIILQTLLRIPIDACYPSFTLPNASASLIKWRSDLNRYVVQYLGLA